MKKKFANRLLMKITLLAFTLLISRSSLSAQGLQDDEVSSTNLEDPDIYWHTDEEKSGYLTPDTDHSKAFGDNFDSAQEEFEQSSASINPALKFFPDSMMDDDESEPFESVPEYTSESIPLYNHDSVPEYTHESSADTSQWLDAKEFTSEAKTSLRPDYISLPESLLPVDGAIQDISKRHLVSALELKSFAQKAAQNSLRDDNITIEWKDNHESPVLTFNRNKFEDLHNSPGAARIENGNVAAGEKGPSDNSESSPTNNAQQPDSSRQSSSAGSVKQQELPSENTPPKQNQDLNPGVQHSGVKPLLPEPPIEAAKLAVIGNKTLIAQAGVPAQPTAIPPSGEIKTVTPSNAPQPAAAPQPATAPEDQPFAANAGDTGETPPRTILINFNNVSIIEYIRFISRITSRNFIFDENDLQFNVTIISEEPATFDNILTALIQELNIHGLNLIEQGDSFIIHRNPEILSISKVVSDNLPNTTPGNTELITQVFRLNTVDADKVGGLLRSMVSKKAIVQVLKENNQVIVTDLSSNIAQIALLLKSIDSPSSGLVVGQYVVKNAFIDALVTLAQKIMQPIALDQTLTFVPHTAANSIFVVSTPFLVERSISILQHLDQNQGSTRIFDLNDLKFEQQKYPSQGAGGGQPQLGPGGRPLNAPSGGAGAFPTGTTTAPGGTVQPSGPQVPSGRANWERDEQGNWIYRPPVQTGQPLPGQGGVQPGGIGARPGATGVTGVPGATGAQAGQPGGQAGGAGATGAQPGAPGAQPGQPGALPGGANAPEGPPLGTWVLDNQGVWVFQPGVRGVPGATGAAAVERPGGTGAPVGAPEGSWVKDRNGNWVFQLKAGKSITPEVLVRENAPTGELPAMGNPEVTQFYHHKLLYRKGDQIQKALKNIASSLQSSGTTSGKLISAINSVQMLEPSNSLIFTGTAEFLEKIKELVKQVDVPLRQVFVEILILDTTLNDSLEFGVNWGSRSGGGQTSTAQAFLTAGTGPLAGALDTAKIVTTGAGITSTIPDANTLGRNEGYNMGIIGEKLTHGGTQFSSIGAVVHALRNDITTNVVLNPKLIVEDNQTANIFVGENTSFKTQSISNDQGSVITNNFEFRDVGTTIKITPMIGNNNVISLDISEEVSSVTTTAGGGGNTLTTEAVGPTTNVQRTVTKVNVPDGYFVILSGMIQDTDQRNYEALPCLGGIPVLGALFSSRISSDDKRNLMIFIRPKIIDTEAQFDDITKHQQDIYYDKCRMKKNWDTEKTFALEWLNLTSTNPQDEFDECDEGCW